MPAASTLKKSAAVAAGTLAAGIGYASVIERNAFVTREVTMPVLTPGSTPLRVLHISDIHMRPNQRRKQAWLRELAGLAAGSGGQHRRQPVTPQGGARRRAVAGRPAFRARRFRVRQQRLLRAAAEEPGQLPDQSVAPLARPAAAVAGPAGGVHRARLARHDPHPPRHRGGRAADRRRGRRRPAPEARPLRDDRGPCRPDRQPAAGR